MAADLLKYEINGLEGCSREIEVRFWWKKSLPRVLSVFIAGELQDWKLGQAAKRSSWIVCGTH
jgi:hypothetical protein